MKTVEEKIYEFIGIKQFKKLVVWIGKKVRGNQKISKEDNYFLHKLTTDGVKDFKKYGIKVNTLIHLGVLPFFISRIFTTSSKIFIPLYILGGVTNLYCVILQRYNTIRLNRIYKKMQEREERKSNQKTEALKEQKSKLKQNELNHKIKHLKALKNELINQQNIEQDNYKIKKLSK